jgi:hypothetical protein
MLISLYLFSAGMACLFFCERAVPIRVAAATCDGSGEVAVHGHGENRHGNP